MHIKPCSLEEIPLGAVVSLISRSKFVFLNNHLRSLGLTAGQFPVLMLLSHKENIMQEDLVRHYRLDKGTIARSVRKLENGGYISRITDPTNRRAVRLFLTQKGEDAIPTLKMINREWEEQINNGLSTAERKTLQSLMRRMAKNSLLIMENDGENVDEQE